MCYIVNINYIYFKMYYNIIYTSYNIHYIYISFRTVEMHKPVFYFASWHISVMNGYWYISLLMNKEGLKGKETKCGPIFPFPPISSFSVWVVGKYRKVTK